MSIAGFTVAFVLGWIFAFVILGIFPFLVLGVTFMSKAMKSGFEEQMKSFAKSGAYAE